MSKYAVIIGKSRTGYSGYVPDLPGCVAVGPTAEETERLVAQAIELHLDGMREDGESIPPPTTTAHMVEISDRVA